MRIIGLIVLVSVFALYGQTQNLVSETGKEEHVRKRATAKNVILLIGDGMGVAHLYAGMTVNKGHLNIEKMKHIGLLNVMACMHRSVSLNIKIHN